MRLVESHYIAVNVSKVHGIVEDICEERLIEPIVGDSGMLSISDIDIVLGD